MHTHTTTHTETTLVETRQSPVASTNAPQSVSKLIAMNTEELKQCTEENKTTQQQQQQQPQQQHIANSIPADILLCMSMPCSCKSHRQHQLRYRRAERKKGAEEACYNDHHPLPITWTIPPLSPWDNCGLAALS